MAKNITMICDVCGEDVMYTIEDGFYVVEPCANCISSAEDEAIAEFHKILQGEKREEE